MRLCTSDRIVNTKRYVPQLMVILCLVFTHGNSQLVPNLGGQRSGISSYQFLKIGGDSRGVAMGEAIVAVTNDAAAIFWNPAGLTNSTEDHVIFSHAEWLVDIQHEFMAASYHLDENNVIGFSFISLRSDPMKVTTEYEPRGTGEYFTYNDIAVGATFAKKMTEQFSFGATVKYIRESIGDLNSGAVLIDLGTFYYLGIGSSRFSVVVSNFGNNVAPQGTTTNGKGENVSSFQEFSPPTMFKLGYAFEAYDADVHRLTVSVQLNHPNDNAENIRVGSEYAYDKLFFLRAGIKRTIGESLTNRPLSTAEDFSFGGGINMPLGFTEAKIDYSFTNFNDLGSVHRISLGLSY